MDQERIQKIYARLQRYLQAKRGIGLSDIGTVGDSFGAGHIMQPSFAGNLKPRGNWGMLHFRQYDLLAPELRPTRWDRLWRPIQFALGDYALIGTREWSNIVVNAGRDYAIDTALSAGTQITTWYVSLVSGGTPTFAAADTMASHGGWTEFTSYSEANRPTWTDAGVSGGVVTNTASKAQFTVNGSGTVGGGFLTSNNTKGGTTGTLYAEGDFTPDRTVIATDVLQVTAQFSLADDGV